MFGRPHATRNTHPVAPVPNSDRIDYRARSGWRAFGAGQHQSDQIGAFAGSMLNQTPANIPGVQLHQGVEGLNPKWYYPAVSALPYGSQMQTQQLAAVLSASRYGQTYTGPIGPLSARANAQRVADQQVRQTGVQALAWVRSLGNGLNPSASMQSSPSE